MANNSFSAGDLTLSIDAIADGTLKKLDMLVDRLSFIEGSLKHISGTARGISKTPKSRRSQGDFGSKLLSIGKWTAVIHSARRLGRLMGNISQSGADYTETLNLWQTAMGNNLGVATEFVNKMNEAYGISEKTLMNAQAIFKNMLGSLGEISGDMAYSLSEGITQMALDYASLYNVTFENAFTKFQAALAGQVRPIRSVSGFDITENTLFQLYQSLGGEKTMRQLSRTEKQLLSILAVFQQMNASGAVGDLQKTMGSFANQSRVWAESLNEVKTWLGVILTYTIQESGIMIKLNAIVITVARYLEALAKSMNAIQSFGGADPFAGTEQGALDAVDAVDKLNGKLLDFDKFRSLSSNQESALGLDQKLMAALSSYDTILGDASLEARQLSDEWLKILGYSIDANGELVLTNEQFKSAKAKIDSITSTLSKFDGLNTLKSVFPIVSTFFTTLAQAAPAIVSISTAMSPIIIGLINSTAEIVTLLDKLGLLQTVIQTIIAYKIARRLISFGGGLATLTTKYLIPFFTHLKTHSTTTLPLATQGITTLQTAMLGLSGAFVIGGLTALLNSEMSAGQKMTHVFLGLAAAIVAGAIALSAFHGNWVKALTVAGLVAGGYYTVTALNVPNYEKGASDIDSGTIFRAGEFGKTEAVFTGSNGKTNVANIQQMKTAYTQSLNEWWAHAKHDIPAFQGVSESGIYTMVDGEARRRGKTFSNVR